MKSLSVILLAGGKGTRMNSSTPKQFLNLNQKPIIEYSFDFFKNFPGVNEIIIVCEKAYESLFQESHQVKLSFALPGKERQDSVYHGLQKVSKSADLVCIHDGARPFLNQALVSEVIKEATLHGAATLAVPVKFTVKEVDQEGFVTKTLDRTSLFEIQTPQVIKLDLLQRGFEIALKEDLQVTDDVSLVELQNKPVKLVMGSYQNIKITTKEDLAFAEKILD